MGALQRIKDKVARAPKGDALYLLNEGAKHKRGQKGSGVD
jgi:hypothetical protein